MSKLGLGWIVFVLTFSSLSVAQTTFSPEALRQDFDFVVQTIQDIHPDPYTKIFKEALERLQTQVESELTQPMTAAAFYELVKPYVASLQDDHTSLVFGELEVEPDCEGDGRRGAYIRAGDVRVLDLPTFSVGGPDEVEMGLESFADFFEQAFTTFRERNLHTLVIDLRKNGGEDSRVGDMLVSYITDQPYRMFARIDAKLSKQALEWLRRYGEEILEDDIASAVGETVTGEPPLETPPPTSLRFGGDVFVLTSRCTASSATDFAAVVKDFGLGTVVGEETGGLPTDFGDSIIFTLPETGLELRVSYKYFVRPGGFDDGRGVLPDCETVAKDAKQAVLLGECQPIVKQVN